MANDPPTPSLALSDIMHTMSPSPAPQPTNDGLQKELSAEPLSEADIAAMRRRIHDMGIGSGENENAGSREKELADMVGLHRKIIPVAYIVPRFCD